MTLHTQPHKEGLCEILREYKRSKGIESSSHRLRVISHIVAMSESEFDELVLVLDNHYNSLEGDG